MSSNDSTPIKTVDDLKRYLQVAMKVEHATIPIYLTALYSIKTDGDYVNRPSANIIREVVVEEMLHLTLVANILNAIGGQPDLLAKDFVPDYPGYLPTGESDFQAGLCRFSKDAIDKVFLKIERRDPDPARDFIEMDGVRYIPDEKLDAGRKSRRGMMPHYHFKSGTPDAVVLHYWSIGDFYRAILNAFEDLNNQFGEKLFSGDPSRQIGPEYYFSSGGDLNTVKNIEDVRTAIDLIACQGEGGGEKIYDKEGELSHLFRFDQISKGCFYVVESDQPWKPTGREFKIDWTDVYPILENAKIAQYEEGSEIREAALTFNRCYWNFLEKLNRGFNGVPDEFRTIYKDMFVIRDAANRLVRYPLPSGDTNAAPTFEMPEK